MEISANNLYIGVDMSKSHKMLSAGRFLFKTPQLHARRKLSHHVILYIEYGEWDINFCERTFKMHSGDVVFMPANILHFGKTKCAPNTRGIFLHFDAAASDGAFSKPTMNSDFLFFPVVLPTKGEKSISSLFSIMLQYNTVSTNCKDKICEALFDSLLVLLEDISSLKNKPLLNVVNDILHNNNECFLTNLQISEKIGLSKKSLEHKFKSQTGKTLQQHQLDIKIKQACEIMTSMPEMSITEIAMMLGFYDSAHFCHTFKQ